MTRAKYAYTTHGYKSCTRDISNLPLVTCGAKTLFRLCTNKKYRWEFKNSLTLLCVRRIRKKICDFHLLLLLSLGSSLGSLLGDLLLLLLIDVVDVVRSSVTDEVADLFLFSLGASEGAELEEGEKRKM